MESTPITEPMRQITLQAIRKKGITKAQLAEATGNGSSWVTKFLDGTLRTIKETSMHAVVHSRRFRARLEGDGLKINRKKCEIVLASVVKSAIMQTPEGISPTATKSTK